MKHNWDAQWGVSYCEACGIMRTPMNDAADDCPGEPVKRKHDWQAADGKLTHCATCSDPYYTWRLDSECRGQKPTTDELFPGNRKEYPVFTGLLMYFPNACAAVARCSYVMNEQHNPGEPMHWAKHKSIGTGDETVRHLMDSEYGTPAGPGDVEHAANHAWRAMEYLERLILRKRAAAGPTEPAKGPCAVCHGVGPLVRGDVCTACGKVAD